MTSGTAEVSQSGNTFTVTPSSNCTVRINFELIPKYTASFSVNGTITSSHDYEEDESITFPDDPDDVNGKTFVGWATAAIPSITQTAPSFVTSATMGTAAVTFYAVFANAASSGSPSLTKMTSSDGFAVNDKVVIVASDNIAMYQETYNSSYVNKYTFVNNAATVADDDKNWFTVSEGSNGTWKLGDDTNGYVYTSGSNNLAISTENSTDFTLDWNSTENKFTLVGNSRWLSYRNDIDTKYFRLGGATTGTASGVIYFDIYKFSASTVTYSNYCTTVPAENTWTVTYNANGGTGEDLAVPGYANNATVTVKPNTGDGNPNFTRAGYTFVKWNTENNGSGTSYSNPATQSASATFTITEDITLYAQWTADEHDITKSDMTNGSVTVKVGDIEVSKADTDETVTLEVSPNTNYVLESLTVTQGLSTVTLSPTFSPSIHTYTFTMPAGNVNVSASFKIAWTVQFSVNGTVNDSWTKVVEENEEIGELPTPANSDIPDGFTFKGWTASTQYYHASDAPTMITASTQITDNKTYAAVFAESYEGSSLTTATLTESEITTNITNTTCAYGTEKSYNDTGDGIKWTASCYTDAASRKWMQLKNDNTAYIKIEASDNIKRVDVTITSAQNASQGINDITKHDPFSNSGTISLRTASNGGDNVGSTSGSSIDNNVATINTTVNKTTVYLKVSTGARVWGITVKCAPTEYKNYTTLVTDQSISGNTTGETRIFGEIAATAGFTNNGTITIYDGGVLNMGNYKLTNTDATKLIIEDGGQLILKDGDDDVAATVKKNITAPTEWNQNDKTGWYAISSTVGTISDITSVSNFANQTFDLYKYVESSNVGYGWINYNNPAQTSTFGGLVNGQGYLYARQNGATVSFTGNVNHTDVELTGLTANNSANENLRGIHLIGNPYTHNIYKGVALTATKGAMSSTYYRLDGNNLWVVESDDTPIGPGQGFLVKVTENNTSLTFSNNASSSKANNDYIRFAVSNSEYEDATFALFQKGEGLRKINHRNTEAPMIYISQNDANYASATMDDDTKSFNLNFEAKTMGQYKLSYKVNGEFNYLHVIDRTTGEDIDMLLEGSYSFIGSPMDNANRFIVRLGYLPNYDDNGKDIFAYQNGNDIVVSGEGELQIFDVMGRKVSTMNIYGIETVNGLAQGVYIFRLEGKTQKIVVR